MTVTLPGTQVAVHGSWRRLDGKAEVGFVNFTAQPLYNRLTHVESAMVILPSPINQALDLNGEVAFSVPATDDPAYDSGVPFQYVVTINLKMRRYSFPLDVPAGTEGVIELGNYSPASTPPGGGGGGSGGTVTNLPSQINLVLYAGSSVSFPLTVTQGGAPLDLTGASVRSAVYTDDTYAEEVAVFDTSIDGNVIIHSMAATRVASLPANCFWNCTVSAPAAYVLAIGTITVLGKSASTPN